MNSPQIPDPDARAQSLARLRQTSREIAEFNRELAEIEAQLDRELYEQKMIRMGKIDRPSSDSNIDRENLPTA